jgi:hypothetical protein
MGPENTFDLPSEEISLVRGGLTLFSLTVKEPCPFGFSNEFPSPMSIPVGKYFSLDSSHRIFFFGGGRVDGSSSDKDMYPSPPNNFCFR